jgi:protein tyrosine/serine phosphatase
MHRCPWLTTPGAILLGVLPLVTSGYGWYRVETGNFHTVVSGHVYRSGQRGRKYWTAYLQHYGIKSLLNLRGEHPGSRWYQKETRVVDALGVTHYDVRLSATREVDTSTLETLLAMLRQAPKPLWIHGQSGADRTGLVAALYLFAIEGQRAQAAAQQLSLF